MKIRKSEYFFLISEQTGYFILNKIFYIVYLIDIQFIVNKKPRLLYLCDFLNI